VRACVRACKNVYVKMKEKEKQEIGKNILILINFTLSKILFI